jgi:hypothetical protein
MREKIKALAKAKLITSTYFWSLYFIVYRQTSFHKKNAKLA